MLGTESSCCSIADGRRTEADRHRGRWRAKGRDQRVPIPHASKPSGPSFDGSAHVCSTPARAID